jgi:hypothetical protein
MVTIVGTEAPTTPANYLSKDVTVKLIERYLSAATAAVNQLALCLTPKDKP